MNVKSPNDKQSAETHGLALKETNARYRLLMNLSGDGIIIVQEGIIKESNRCMAQLCGCHPDSMRDTALTQYFPPDQNPGVKAMIDTPNHGASEPQVRAATLGR